MSNQQEIIDLQNEFGERGRFTTTELANFFKKNRAEISAKAIHWKIHTLKTNDVISSLGRGLYQWKKGEEKQTKNEFEGKLTAAERALFAKIKAKYPLIQVCIWQVRWLHEFMTHLPSVSWTLVEVDKDVSESVFSLLRNSRHDVYFNPNRATMEHQLAYDRKAVIVKDLISQAPLTQSKGVPCPVLEKVIVDLCIDKAVFDIYQGSELRNIMSEIFRRHQINLSRLKRYATRRNAWDRISEIIEEAMEN